MAVRSIAPAKINLALNIKNKRDDNYHEVDMVMQSINIYDYITVEEADNTIINVECKELGNCNLNDNIAYKAAEKFFEYTNVKNKGVYIHIKKIYLYARVWPGEVAMVLQLYCLWIKYFVRDLS